MCAYVNVCEYVSVCREQCKKTQYWLFIYVHKIYGGYKKNKMLQITCNANMV